MLLYICPSCGRGIKPRNSKGRPFTYCDRVCKDGRSYGWTRNLSERQRQTLKTLLSRIDEA